MTRAITAYYIATVWMDEAIGGDWGDTTRSVIRLQAIGPDDFKARVSALWPDKTITFGPVGKSRIQE